MPRPAANVRLAMACAPRATGPGTPPPPDRNGGGEWRRAFEASGLRWRKAAIGKAWVHGEPSANLPPEILM